VFRVLTLVLSRLRTVAPLINGRVVTLALQPSNSRPALPLRVTVATKSLAVFWRRTCNF
jgi:hypothetical protein